MTSSDESDGGPPAEGEPTSETAEDAIDAESVGGLGELVPEPLQPAWRRVESFQEFRRVHGDTYVTALEAIVAAVLAGGYLYWLSLFLSG